MLIIIISSAAVLLLVLAIVGGYFLFFKKSTKEEVQKSETTTAKTQGEAEEWEKGQVVVPGKYADADVVELPDGRLRMYFALEPEAPGFEAQVYSAVSPDGITWTKEDGERMKGATFPSVLKLPDGTWRMYFQGAVLGSPPASAILSATSKDGLNWTKEEGVRIKRSAQGTYDTENVADPSVVRLSDGTYLMVYRGQAGENTYNKTDEFRKKPMSIDYLISATSKDGLSWTPLNLIVDSRNDEMRDQILGPELIVDGNTLKLYSNSFAGVYVLALNNKGEKVSEPKLIMKSTGPNDAPSDMTLVRYKDDWKMYFGMHTRGIFAAKRVQ